MRPVALVEVWPEFDEASRREVGRELEQARPGCVCRHGVTGLGMACGESGEDADLRRCHLRIDRNSILVAAQA